MRAGSRLTSSSNCTPPSSLRTSLLFRGEGGEMSWSTCNTGEGLNQARRGKRRKGSCQVSWRPDPEASLDKFVSAR
jgi:hypothetical protein